MNRYSLLILAVALIISLFSCTIESAYTNYTWDGTNYTDADSDGIPDIAEAVGTSFYDMPLYDWGARPGTPDLFIHVAPMVAGPDPNDPNFDDAGMLLQKKALDRVVAAFAAQGIAVHFDVGKTRLYEGYNEITGRGVSTYNMSGKDHSVPYNKSIYLTGTSTGYVYVDKLKAQYLPNNRYQIFYFLVFGSSQEADGSSGSSGVAWSPGRDFLVTLAKWGLGFGTNTSLGLTFENFENYVVNKQASTIMHEFGHNMGLGHGGFESLNYKPNYYSIMNYLYQLNGLPRIGTSEGDRYYYNMDYYEYLYNNTGGVWDTKWRDLITKTYDPQLYEFDLVDSSFTNTFRMDFSHGEGANIAESSLNENSGLTQSGSIPVDWDGDGTIEASVSVNINPLYDSVIGTHADYNDWGNLYFYYNDHHLGVSRTMEDPDREIIHEYDVPRNSISVQRSK